MFNFSLKLKFKYSRLAAFKDFSHISFVCQFATCFQSVEPANVPLTSTLTGSIGSMLNNSLTSSLSEKLKLFASLRVWSTGRARYDQSQAPEKGWSLCNAWAAGCLEKPVGNHCLICRKVSWQHRLHTCFRLIAHCFPLCCFE